MPLVYDLSLATPGNTTSNASANTENETFFVKPGVRNCALKNMYVIGKGAGLTAISGIVHRIIRWGTASTSGVTITPKPVDPGNQAAKCTSASGPTAGTTRLNGPIFGCGATSPGGWVAQDIDSMELQEGGAATSIDAVNSSGTVSLNFEWGAQVQE